MKREEPDFSARQNRHDAGVSQGLSVSPDQMPIDGLVETFGRGRATIPPVVAVKRSDPVYNAHAYLTKVPYTAITPFIEALTEPGDVVLDVFAGSGMTGVAAAMTGRHAELRDISVLGRHIGTNLLRLVDGTLLFREAANVIEKVGSELGDAYATRCSRCGEPATLAKTIWSFRYACAECGAACCYYDLYRDADWRKAEMRCPECGLAFNSRSATRIGEVPVIDSVRCSCSKSLKEQPYSPPLVDVEPGLHPHPDVEIGPDRQMFHASALAKHDLTCTSAFFSARNLAVLAAINAAIEHVGDADVRAKLKFAFTAILARASKRYQWHPKRPLNAANQTYYIAPVFYEWNVFELFSRKVEASARSDAFIRSKLAARGLSRPPAVNYSIGSADVLDLPDESVDLVFTDPPFGSQLFYSDMNLFQEAWLGELTDYSQEAVVDRTGDGRPLERYEALIVGALRECHRVLKPDGRLCLVFSNSNGEMWGLVQRAIRQAALRIEQISALDKGQRSVKGLASGFEAVITSDLILTMRKDAADQILPPLVRAPVEGVMKAAEAALTEADLTPTGVYLSIVSRCLRKGWRLDGIRLADVIESLTGRGYTIEQSTGRLRRPATAAV